MSTDIPIPAELALADEPFTLDQLEAAFDFLADHDDDGDDPVTLLKDLGAGEAAVEVDPETLPADVREGAQAVARTAGWRLPHPSAANGPALAEWAGRHYAAADRARKAAEAQAQEWRARIDTWEADQCKRHDRVADFFGGELIAYAAEYRDIDPKRNKTLKLPSVVVAGTAQSACVDVEDEEAVIDWAERSLAGDDYDATIKTTTKVLLTGLRKVTTITEVKPGDDEPDDAPTVVTILDAGGQIVPGVFVRPEGVSYKVKVL